MRHESCVFQKGNNMAFPVVVQALWGPVFIDAGEIESAERTPIGGNNVRLNMASGSFITITGASARALRAIGVACPGDSPEPEGQSAADVPEVLLNDFRGKRFLAVESVRVLPDGRVI